MRTRYLYLFDTTDVLLFTGNLVRAEDIEDIDDVQVSADEADSFRKDSCRCHDDDDIEIIDLG